MAETPWKNRANGAKIEAGPKALPTPTTPRHGTPDTEVNDMPFEHDYGDSSPQDNREQFGNYARAIDATVDRLKRQFDWALSIENGELAESYHNRIVALEFLAREAGE